MILKLVENNADILIFIKTNRNFTMKLTFLYHTLFRLFAKNILRSVYTFFIDIIFDTEIVQLLLGIHITDLKIK